MAPPRRPAATTKAYRPAKQRVRNYALTLAVTLGGFLVLAAIVHAGGTQAVDESLLQVLRDPARGGVPRGPWWLPDSARDVTALGSHAVLGMIIVGVAGILLLERKPHLAALVGFAGAGGMVVNNLLKEAFDRPRPEVVQHAVEVHSLSFPSGHAMVTAAVYLSLAVLVTRALEQRAARAYVLAAGLFVTALVGGTRVYLGVHYPTDVIGGWLAGASWALLCGLVALGLQRRGAVESPGPEPDAPP